MDYSEAIKFLNDNENLIGTKTDKGLKIGKLLVVPANEEDRRKFFSYYFFHGDENEAIRPFIGSPVEVWAIDTEFLNKNNVLFYDKLV